MLEKYNLFIVVMLCVFFNVLEKFLFMFKIFSLFFSYGSVFWIKKYVFELNEMKNNFIVVVYV